MPWVPAEFKGKKVWAEIDAEGRAVVEAGRRPVRYSDAPGAKVYSAGSTSVTDSGDRAVELDAGVRSDAPSTPTAPRGSGFGKAGTRTAAQTAAAAEDAKQRLAALPKETVIAFTDGACAGNPGPSGSGCVVKFDGGQTVERYKAVGEGTNNIAELVAIGMALEILREQGVAADAPVAIFTDSSYARGVLSLNWKPKANQGLIGGLRRRLAEWPNAQIYWVAGHAGVPENERADALARKGVYESR